MFFGIFRFKFIYMAIEQDLQERSGGVCELCTSNESLSAYLVPPKSSGTLNDTIHACSVCSGQMNDSETMDANHWRCLNDSMWSQEPPVQVMAWRMLQRLKGEGWPVDLIEMMYLEEDTLKWARSTGDGDDEAVQIIHKDVNGVTLSAGDSVVLIKDLNVKGGGFTAKRGTAVRGISLDPDNDEYIEGRVEGQMVVLITEYVKKQ
jgi:protein PhnA